MSASDDDIAEMQYEDALIDEEPWAMDAHEVRRWAAMQGLRVRADSDEYGPVEGIWNWRGQTSEDFFLVLIVDDDGLLVAGTDPRNFDAVTVLPALDNGHAIAPPKSRKNGSSTPETES